MFRTRLGVYSNRGMFLSKIRRSFKDIAHDHSIAQVKVREATSNDACMPSLALMSELADYSYNARAFTEIMSIVWGRMNDSGKNWRHIYKSLVLLEYLIKAGSERVIRQTRENMFKIETLSDFQRFDGNLDLGMNIREKAKDIVILLRDEGRLRSERRNCQEERGRSIEMGIDMRDGRQTGAMNADSSEEDLQLQVALAMSKQEKAKEDELRNSDEYRLKLALEESCKTEAERISKSSTIDAKSCDDAALKDVFSIGVTSDSSATTFVAPLSSTAWASSTGQLSDSFPHTDSQHNYPSIGDSTLSSAPHLSSSANCIHAGSAIDPFSSIHGNSDINVLLPTPPFSRPTSSTSFDSERVASSFLGSYKGLVNLDNLVCPASTYAQTGTAPSNSHICDSSVSATSINPFTALRKQPTLNEMLRSAK